MARNLPPLNALKAFEAAARHESFTAAARELNVTHAAISRHIRELEGWLGGKLFVRTGRGVELTERGRGYASELTRGFDVIAQATESVSGRRRRRRQKLAVSVEPSLAALWLVPRLGRFTAANPDVDLVLDSTSRLVDFARDEADVGIRYGRGGWPGVTADLLTGTHLTPVASPALLETKRIRTPAELPPGLLLQEESRRYWDEWLTAARVADRVSPEGPTLGLHLTIPAAEACQGFALADEVIAGDALVGGRLVRPFGIAVESYGYFLVRGAERKETRAMAAFHAWVAAEIADTLEAVAKTNALSVASGKRRTG
ncbi:transcriptional regulator GcvA [Hyphomicrobium sp. CS1GBMeth3]|uniref:transcriptional regulator GcvA n=1 Tax=Hyphomicrobium sp. CS1GBMeth3 TaxID=1892845 RepID=UPI000930327E|nr:transcriptional regulator GcvA [Hyphomicrobium sp. CS1GBMeth3]